MNLVSNGAGPIALALVLGLVQAGCSPRTPGTDDAAAAPQDSGLQVASVDRATVPQGGSPDTAAAPPITPPSNASRDTPPAAAKPGKQADQATKSGGLKVSQLEHEGWRQYSVNCARCHGQDVLPNPVAANLLVSVGPGGPSNTPEKFAEVVTKGRPERGMPALGTLLTAEQINAIYAYVKGRAEGRIPPGRPEKRA